jgi:vacuolar-type H+-ATPase subunit B/Vma2
MKYVLKETKETCVVVEEFTDLFGNEMVKIKTQSGQLMDVAKEDISLFLQD